MKRVLLPTDREMGQKRGFAFVEMESEAEEDAAIAALDGVQWMGRAITAKKAQSRSREERGSGSGDGYSRPRY